MRYLFIFIQVLGLMFSLFSYGYAHSWTKFFSIESGYDFFYDENILPYKNDTFLIWQRTIPQNETASNSWIELIELIQIDCLQNRYKRLEGIKKYENRSLQRFGEASWINFEPTEFDIAFYNSTCSKTRRNN